MKARAEALRSSRLVVGAVEIIASEQLCLKG